MHEKLTCDSNFSLWKFKSAQFTPLRPLRHSKTFSLRKRGNVENHIQGKNGFCIWQHKSVN